MIVNNSAKNCNLLSTRLTNYPQLSLVALLHQIPTNRHSVISAAVEVQEMSQPQTDVETFKKWINSPRIRKTIVGYWLGRYEELCCPDTRN